MNVLLQNSLLVKTQGLINGAWVDADQHTTLVVDNPATGDALVSVADMGAAETRRAIDAAHTALPGWSATSATKRSRILEAWYDLVVQHVDELASILTAEQGKPLAEAKGEVLYGASYIKWFAEEARRIYGDVIPAAQADRRNIVIKQPVGVVAAITPWNFPSAMLARKMAPALAAGCTIVCKPAAETPLSALALGVLAQQAGVPAGVINMVVGSDAPAIGNELTSSPLVRKVTFTGSTPVGKLLMKQCADTVKRTSMELGGNAPIIIFDDADLDQAINGALISKFRNSGQTCICSNRLLVQSGIYDRFIERLSEAVSEFRLGAGQDSNTTHGPLITDKAAQGVDEKVKDAVAQGARVVIGGAPAEQGSRFYQPTILADATPDMRVFREEIFGPVAPVFRFETDDEAIALANSTEYGLAAYVFTQNLSRIWRVSEAIDFGMVGVNETAISSEAIPFGGVKESGQGREGSKYGLDDYLETKLICLGGL
ncbi:MULTISPECIES: NAD-dependent succinate-semialdehyde dehydrogenase [unclassified Oceanobacter]|jgi:succinate-semialdehyde dehydrogenase/glutarate-semialdehyde dehydrogenase|uniref:NAD-dependent succinate-semialdehyde dehydrogenase n=1 Tax=unclassified Oceanobacter TaxID=2620260 RepID=UPI0026E4413C|nr:MULTISPECIES: NAD-dependent succinate-semialdehyde dehydrogenase [unclassified Oceanobacter]MDO6683065.1 NAD-dependent succinate-semialdehyde dehydrogenase [Oceanobacter sp. 5_MG-2023]MDP2505872.1 NAD-dependent succinate-semialdehyde dehydrogenase [Oceanobacter sp. 3_MG-2023]MDP2548395.1 NAD-dependent succinate-semialdehyde dehydrogenase [Oceanobacter sp. 4_MG-2023]